MNTAAVVGFLVALAVVTGVIWYVTDRKRRTESLQLVKHQERVEHLENRERAAPIRTTDRAVERGVERDVAHAVEDVPITDEHAGAVDNPRRDRVNPDIQL